MKNAVKGKCFIASVLFLQYPNLTHDQFQMKVHEVMRAQINQQIDMQQRQVRQSSIYLEKIISTFVLMNK